MAPDVQWGFMGLLRSPPAPSSPLHEFVSAVSTSPDRESVQSPFYEWIKEGVGSGGSGSADGSGNGNGSGSGSGNGKWLMVNGKW